MTHVEATEELSPTVTAVVTIGHNGPDSLPLPDSDIADFVIQVDEAVCKVQTAIYATGSTVGRYNGMSELGTVWVFTASGHDVRTVLRPTLAEIAARFGQEAIGLIVQNDQNTLVTP